MGIFNYYSGQRGKKRTLDETELQLSKRVIFGEASHANYIPDEGLVAAANVAIHLGQPLLLTGEPGCGKTGFAHHLNWALGFKDLLRFETKSTTSARDVFYYYDSLGRFHDAQADVKRPSALAYITFNALGVAILRACDGPVAKSLRELSAEDLSDLAGPRERSMVLIDEIDKAPRDFPNDLLTELEEFYFKITEIPALANKRIEANPNLRPIVIITSNSEKSLPDAFLRRCIFYNIPFPDSQQLTAIVHARLGDTVMATGFLECALNLFQTIRDAVDTKRPSVAELLNWLHVLKSNHIFSQKKLEAQEVERIIHTMPVLLKGSDRESMGAERIVELVTKWATDHQKGK